MRDDRERLLDIQEAIADIQKYARRGREEFARDELIQTWIIHHMTSLFWNEIGCMRKKVTLMLSFYIHPCQFIIQHNRV